jgi:hypothetical protein
MSFVVYIMPEKISIMVTQTEPFFAFPTLKLLLLPPRQASEGTVGFAGKRKG